MATEEKLKEDESTSPEAAPVKRDYTKDPNVKKRLNAGKRSTARNAGKEITDSVEPNAEVVPPEGYPTPDASADVPEATGEGGIVAEAEKELEVATEALEEKAEQEGEAPAMEGDVPAMEPEAPAAEDEAPAAEPEAPAMGPEGEAPAMESEAPEMGEAEPEAAVGDYEAPDGEDHDELIDQYHEALMFGDKEAAKELYRKLQNHRYSENSHRSKSEAQAAKEAQAYVDVARKLAAAHPELAEDGLEADKVMALADLYRSHGASAAEALQKAVDDLYPEAPAPESSAAGIVPEPEAPEPEAPAPAPAPEPEAAKPVVPDMTERKNAKRNIPAVPSATVRNEPAPEKKEPTRSDAIKQIKNARGQ